MTEPRQDLPTDPQLSRLYREHAVDEPADIIDQRILSAARQAVASRSLDARRNGWWQRWRMPLCLASTVMLTVMLALLVERQPTELSIAPSREKEAVESTQKRAEPVSIPPAPAKAVQVPASPPVQKALPKAQVGQSETASNRAADQAAAAPSPSTKTESASPASAPSEAVVSGEMRAAPLSQSRADSSRSPAVWLDEIRVLRSAGKTEEAERQLREFRLAYPDYLLPEEFRQ